MIVLHFNAQKLLELLFRQIGCLIKAELCFYVANGVIEELDDGLVTHKGLHVLVHFSCRLVLLIVLAGETDKIEQVPIIIDPHAVRSIASL